MQTQDKDKTKEKTHANVNKIPDWPVGLSMPNSKKLSISIAEDLAVVLTKNAFEQLFGWAYSTSKEISCLGSMHRDGNRFFIDRFYLLKQSGSSAGTELDQEAMAELIEQLMTEGKTDEARRIKCWAHSHPNMDVFWSNMDDATCQLLASDYLISIVISNSFAIRCRLDIAAPVPIVLDNVPVVYEIPREGLLMEKYAEEVRNMVSERFFNFGDKDKGQKQQDKEQTGYMPTSYCGYCGNWHADGDCPLADSENWPNIDDEDFMF